MKPSLTARPEKSRGFDKNKTPNGQSMDVYQENRGIMKNPSLKPATKTYARPGNADDAAKAGGKNPGNRGTADKKRPEVENSELSAPTQSA